jgi:hypothetical protein
MRDVLKRSENFYVSPDVMIMVVVALLFKPCLNLLGKKVCRSLVLC